METGFLNPIHDEEHFTSSFYHQGSGLDDTEHMLFGEMIVPEIIDYDNLWHSVDDFGASGQSGEPETRKEDFQRMLYEWQHQLNYMQEPEAITQIVPVDERTTREVSDMLASRTTSASCPTDPSIDELFPLDENRSVAEPTAIESRLPVAEETATVEDQATPEEDVVLEGEIQVKTVEVETETPAEEESVAPTEEETVAPAEVGTVSPAELGIVVPAQVERESPAVQDGALPVTIKTELEDSYFPVKTEPVEVSEDIPLLMAGDLTSLLEQFEATEKETSVPPPPVASPPRPTNQTIRDALPAEVINRIKATRENHKKMISVIPAMPSKRLGRAATRMQDAGAALSRNKLLKLVTGGSSGESVQLDHDYCTNGDTMSNSSRSYSVSDSSEYPSQSSTPDATYCRLPDYFTVLASQKGKERVRTTDTGSRKDSGMESAETSDEDVLMKNKVVLKSVSGLKSLNVVTENGVVIGSAPVIRNNVPMVSVLKKNFKVGKDDKAVNQSAIPVVIDNRPSECVSPVIVRTAHSDEKGKKRKLNLEEYRVRRERDRIRSEESSRANSPATPPSLPDSTTIASTEGVPKEKPIMLSVEVQTQTCDFIDLTSSKSPKEQEKSRPDRKEKRSDLKHRSYRSRQISTSSSSCSADSDHHRHRRKRRSRSKHRRSSVSRMWSRSPSPASSRTHSVTSSHSRSRSRSRDKRQKWRSRSPRRSNGRYHSFHGRDNRDWSWRDRARSPVRPVRNPEFGTQEKVRQVEERRVIYVGRIDEGTSKADLRKRFQQFGPIVDISVHFRERGDNYGFVTFAYKADAYKAVEHGNDDPTVPRYDLCFGGRRAFCKQRYADLDGIATNMHGQYGSPSMPPQRTNESFDLLLHEVKAQLRKRSSV